MVRNNGVKVYKGNKEKYEHCDKLFANSLFFFTTELHYSSKKREHSLSILKSFFLVRHLSEYETSGKDRRVKMQYD